MPSFDELLACPRCSADLRALRCAGCGASYEERGGVIDLRLPSDQRTERVRDFYAAAPFPGVAPREDLSALRARAARSEFARLLDAAIPGDATVLELGCGTGQLSLFLAGAERLVVGADLTRQALVLAQQAAAQLGVDGVRFVETDLRKPGLRRGAFDVVICSGVLHHTPDPRASFTSVAALARPGGIVVLGLYNAFARLPLRLRRLVARLTGFRWVPFDPVLSSRSAEPARRLAWLRDQYRHVEEHRHTLREVQQWFRDNGVEYLRTFPSSLLEDERGDLFEQAPDDWAPEALLAQLGWMRTLGGEGGLFVAVGSRRS